MILYVKYDENEKLADIVDIPNFSLDTIKQKQNEFFKWLFNKDNDHKYWREIDGVKSICAYDVSAFIEWLNSYVCLNSKDKAVLLKKDAICENENMNVLLF